MRFEVGEQVRFTEAFLSDYPASYARLQSPKIFKVVQTQMIAGRQYLRMEEIYPRKTYVWNLFSKHVERVPYGERR